MTLAEELTEDLSDPNEEVARSSFHTVTKPLRHLAFEDPKQFASALSLLEQDTDNQLARGGPYQRGAHLAAQVLKGFLEDHRFEGPELCLLLDWVGNRLYTRDNVPAVKARIQRSKQEKDRRRREQREAERKKHIEAPKDGFARAKEKNKAELRKLLGGSD
ncbi:MAG: hypothetical protein SX243_22675 [Acidobacteriota bacterium]|nr:hypothetical protein [Acidobacteriota bacterium]